MRTRTARPSRHVGFDFCAPRFRSAQVSTVGRLRNEPAVGATIPAGFTCGPNARIVEGPTPGTFGGCEDVNYTPAYPITGRVMATVFLD